MKKGKQANKSISMYQEEKDIIEAYAKKKRMSVSAVMVKLTLDHIKKENKEKGI